MNNEITKNDFYLKLEILEKALIENNNGELHIGNSDFFPLKHSFSEGLYIREIFLPKGSFAIGKIHKEDHVVFLLKGELDIITPDGVETYMAPCYVNAKAGTKRAVLAIKDCIFVNVHPNPSNTQDIQKLEQEFTCPTLTDYAEYKLLNK